MVPLIPILAGLGILVGGGTLIWYDNLSREEKARANQLTADFAGELFGKTVDQLSAYEAQTVHDRVKAYFDN